jgi:hypothetical protein
MEKKTMSHYDKYKNLYVNSVKREDMVGAIPHPDHVILYVIPRPKEAAMVGKLLVQESSERPSEPLVFEVIAGGTRTPHKAGDLVCISFLAGDRFRDSDVVVCHKNDIILTWGRGLCRS